jgi:hypothetical protein
MELLEADYIGILLPDKFDHFWFMAGGAFLFGDVFIEASDIPGKQAQCVGGLFGTEVFPGVKSQETVDIGPAKYQSDKREQGPAAAGREEEGCNKEGQNDQQQQREYQT